MQAHRTAAQSLILVSAVVLCAGPWFAGLWITEQAMPFLPNSLLIISLLIVYVVLFLFHLQCGVVNHKTTTYERNKETKINIM